MTQQQLDSAVATATGESLHRIRRHGFCLLEPTAQDHSSDEIHLVIDCPFCSGAIPIPAPQALRTAECDHCELAFAYQAEEVYVATEPLRGPRYSTLVLN